MQTSSRKTILLATDQQRSILNALDATQNYSLAYTPYGYRRPGSSLLGFNGELPDPVTGHYPLGNGYRGFNPVFMRFNSPDSWSPFGKGGMNAYTYCKGDPVGQRDPSGHVSVFTSFLKAAIHTFKVSNIKFKISAAAVLAGSAGLVAEAFVPLDKTPNYILLYGSSFLLGAGLGGMHRFRPSRAPRMNTIPSRSLPRAQPIDTRRAPRTESIELQNFSNSAPAPAPAPRRRIALPQDPTSTFARSSGGNLQLIPRIRTGRNSNFEIIANNVRTA
jgi:RHS repeat-associated protein